MIITRIQRKRGKKPRYVISLDGQPGLEVSDWTLGKFGLRAGDDIDGDVVDGIKTAESDIQAKNTAINFLSYRPRSGKEIVDHLIKKGFRREIGSRVVQHLHALGMIDDEKFAYAFARDRMRKKPVGEALLRKELGSKGITGATAEKVLLEILPPAIQQEAALRAVQKKLRTLQSRKSKHDTDTKKKRLLDFLLRRGFPYEIALKTIHRTLD